MKQTVKLICYMTVAVIILVGCTNDEKEIISSFKAPLKLGKEWKLYEASQDKTIYINPLYQTVNNGQRRFKMIKKANNLDAHKGFVGVTQKQPQFKHLKLNRYSYMRTDELADCSAGTWITEKHFLVDRDGIDMAEIDGRDLDDSVYRITPEVQTLICK